MDASRIKGLLTSLPGRYSRALFEVALEQQHTDIVLECLKKFNDVVVGDKHLQHEMKFMDEAEFSQTVHACAQAFSWPAYVFHFFKLLHKSKRLTALPEIVRIFETLSDVEFDRLPVLLSLPSLPTHLQKTQLEEKITALFGKKIRYEYESIPSLLGGFVASVNDTLQIDASVSTQITRLHHTLKATSLQGAA